MPVYDCGVPDCTECQREFGPDRSIAIAEYRSRLAAQPKPLSGDEMLVIAARQTLEKFDALSPAEQAALPPLGLLNIRLALRKKDGLTILGHRSIQEEIAAIEAEDASIQTP